MKRTADRLQPALLIAWRHRLPSHAGEGHDHGDAPAGAQRQRPAAPARRQRVPAQARAAPAGACARVVTEAAELPRTVELAGKVLMDPNAGGKVQPTERRPHRAGPARPAERRAGGAQGRGAGLCACRRRRPSSAPTRRRSWPSCAPPSALADKRVARLQELADTVPRKEIEAAESEVASLAARIARRRRRPVQPRGAGGAGVRRDRLGQRGGRPGGRCARAGLRDRRPVAPAHRGAGLRRRASAPNVGGATLAVGDERVPLHFVGAARSAARAGAAAGLPRRRARRSPSWRSASRCGVRADARPRSRASRCRRPR